MDKKKLTGKQIKFIINLICFIVFSVSYFVISTNYIKKTDSLYDEVENVKVLIEDRKDKLSQEDEVIKDIEEVDAQKQKIIDKYPSYIAKEDNYMFVEKLKDDLNLKASSVNVSDSMVFYDTIVPAKDADDNKEVDKSDKDEENDIKTMQGMQSNISMSFITSSQGLKALAEYIKNYSEQTVIDNVTISYDNTSGNLSGSVALIRYAISGTGKEYISTPIEGTSIGTDDLFGTDDE